jgi:hypothetical protein
MIKTFSLLSWTYFCMEPDFEQTEQHSLKYNPSFVLS